MRLIGKPPKVFVSNAQRRRWERMEQDKAERAEKALNEAMKEAPWADDINQWGSDDPLRGHENEK